MRRKFTVVTATVLALVMALALSVAAVTYYKNGSNVIPTGTKGIQSVDCGTNRAYIQQYSFDFAWTDSTGSVTMRYKNDHNGLYYSRTFSGEFDGRTYRWSTYHPDISQITYKWVGLSGTFSSARITRGCY